MSSETRIVAHSGKCILTISNPPDDPLSWIVEQYSRSLFGKRRTLSRWFLLREQAERFAEKLAKECGAR